MAQNRKPRRGFWDGDDFVDIRSHSDGEVPQRARPLKETGNRRPRSQQRPAPPGRPRPAGDRASAQERPVRPPQPGGRPARPGQRPLKEAGNRRPRSQQRSAPARPPQPGGRPVRPGQRPRPGKAPAPKRPPQPRKRRPPMKKGLRRLLMLGGIFVMLAVTCVLAISLLFKISEITVTGDVVYQTEDILRLCEYEVGDNLFFITTSDRVKKLKAQLPYIADVEIRRHIPGTLEIHITGTQVACCVFSEGMWLYVSGEGKILETQPEPREGVMRIEGLAPQNPQAGGMVQVEDKGLQEAYSTILEKIVELGAWGEFTRLDITDPYNITLWYQDRVECKLGNAAELDYKVQFGYKLLREGHIGEDQTGVLDLSYADVRRAGFTSQPVDPAGQASPASASGGESQPEEGESPDSSTEEESGGRGDDIPDEPIG